MPPGGWITRGIDVGIPDALEAVAVDAVSEGWYKMLVSMGIDEYVFVPMGTMLVGAVVVDGSNAREVDAAVGAGDAGVVETTDVNGGDDASVLEATPTGTVVSSVEVALERLEDALLSAVADAAVASEEVAVVEASLDAAEDAAELTSEVAVALLASVPEDRSRVVPLDKGMDVVMPTAAEVVMVALLGKKEGVLEACEAVAARDDSTEESDAETEEAIDD